MKYSQLKLALLIVCSGATSPFVVQTSGNVVGYYNRSIYPGDNLIANQLIATNNSIDSLLVQGVPDGSTFTKWDTVANEFMPYSVFDANSGSWSINYNFNPVDGQGGVLHSPSPFTNTFVGEVYQGHDAAHQVNGPLFGVWDGPPRGGGLFLLADQDPHPGKLHQGRWPRSPGWGVGPHLERG